MWTELVLVGMGGSLDVGGACLGGASLDVNRACLESLSSG